MVNLKSHMSAPLMAILWSSMASAARINCGPDPVTNFRLQDLLAFKATFDNGEWGPIQLSSLFGFKSSRALIFGDIQLCLNNDTPFKGATVFEDELSAFMQGNIDCLNRVRDGRVLGDTRLEVQAILELVNDAASCGRNPSDSLEEFQGGSPLPEVVEVGFGTVPARRHRI
jgi:hypothetical protein